MSAKQVERNTIELAHKIAHSRGISAVAARNLRHTGRSEEEIERFESYFRAQGLFGMPAAADIDYTRLVTIALDDIEIGDAGGAAQGLDALREWARAFPSTVTVGRLFVHDGTVVAVVKEILESEAVPVEDY